MNAKKWPSLETYVLWLVGMKKKITCIKDYCSKHARITCNTPYVANKYSLRWSDEVTLNKEVVLILKSIRTMCLLSYKKTSPIILILFYYIITNNSPLNKLCSYTSNTTTPLQYSDTYSTNYSIPIRKPLLFIRANLERETMSG